jgi:uncharacterized protein YbjT (DUF2867 family)
MTGTSEPRRVLFVGGTGGLLGRAALPEFSGDYQVRSVHRNPVPAETTAGVEWLPLDAGRFRDWRPVLDGVDVVVTLAWHRWGNATRFRRLYEGYHALLAESVRARVSRFLHVSVPAAPEPLERGLPYLSYKRRFDRELSESGLSYRILRPTMMFGARDRLLTVMLRTMRRYGRLPMFGDGEYHVSPVAAADVARLLRLEAEGPTVGTVDVGGPSRYTYRSLTDRMFESLRRPAQYWYLSPRTSVAMAQLLQDLGSTLLYAYEVEWLLSDRLGVPPMEGLDRPLLRVEPFLDAEALRLTTKVSPRPG